MDFCLRTSIKFWLLLVSVVLLGSCQSDNEREDSLKTLSTLAVIHRHGDRNPIKTYPNDPYGDIKYWPDGWGQLTIAGKRRLYALGKFIRRRYASFLTDDPMEVGVRSSGANRCLNSVQCLLAGAYPPKGRFVIDPQLNWQPFPIMTLPRIHDSMLNPGSTCAKGSQELARLRNSPEAKKFLAPYGDLLRYLTKNAGREVNDYTTAEYIHDDLFIEQNAGYKLPAWVTPKVFSDLKEISDRSFHLDATSTTIQRLRAGIFFKDLTDHFTQDHLYDHDKMRYGHKYRDQVTDEDEMPKKFYVYSTHDTQIALVLESLKANNMKAPPYAASIFFELHFSNNSHFVRLFYLNETYSEELQPIIPTGCDSHHNCKLGQFIKGLSDIIIDDKQFFAECNEGPIIVHMEIGKGLFFLLIAGMMAVLVCLLCSYLKRKKSSSSVYVYKRLPMSSAL